VSRFRDLIGEDVIELKLIERSSSIIALLFALDRTIFYSVPFKVPALNRVTGGGPYTLVRRDIVFKPSWSIDLSTVNRFWGRWGKDTLVTDGTLVRQSAPETFDAVTPRAIPDSIYGFISGNSDTFGIHQFGRRLSTNDTGYSTIQSSYLRHLASGLVFHIPISAEASTTSRYLLSVVSMNPKNVDVLTNTKQVVTLRKM
jgi:hypothetical protein